MSLIIAVYVLGALTSSRSFKSFIAPVSKFVPNSETADETAEDLVLGRFMWKWTWGVCLFKHVKAILGHSANFYQNWPETRKWLITQWNEWNKLFFLQIIMYKLLFFSLFHKDHLWVIVIDDQRHWSCCFDVVMWDCRKRDSEVLNIPVTWLEFNNTLNIL